MGELAYVHYINQSIMMVSRRGGGELARELPGGTGSFVQSFVFSFGYWATVRMEEWIVCNQYLANVKA